MNYAKKIWIAAATHNKFLIVFFFNIASEVNPQWNIIKKKHKRILIIVQLVQLKKNSEVVTQYLHCQF